MKMFNCNYVKTLARRFVAVDDIMLSNLILTAKHLLLFNTIKLS